MSKLRLYTLLSLIFLTPLGFYTKFYQGPFAAWVADSFGGLLYVIFWCLLGLFLFPRVGAGRLCLTIFAITSLLEFLQLWKPPLLTAVRQTFLGSVILGTTFVWSDFFYYFIGALCAWYGINFLKRQTAS